MYFLCSLFTFHSNNFFFEIDYSYVYIVDEESFLEDFDELGSGSITDSYETLVILCYWYFVHVYSLWGRRGHEL